MDGISLIIPSLGPSKNLSNLLNSIELQVVDFPVEVIVICNNIKSEFETEFHNKINCLIQASLKTPINIKCITLPGVNRSRNLGLLLAQYSIVFFIDDDCELDDPYLLAKHWSWHQQYNLLFAVGGGYSIKNNASFFSQLYQEIQMKWLYKGLVNSSVDRQTKYLIGGHFSAKKNLVLKYKIQFDDKIIYGGSELTFFTQALNNSLKFELLDFSVLHHTTESFLSLQRKIFKQGRGQAIADLEIDRSQGLEKLSKKESENESENIIQNIFFSYYSFIFWLGYFYQKKKLYFLILFLFNNLKNKIYFCKYKILDRINQFIHSKKERGDRL